MKNNYNNIYENWNNYLENLVETSYYKRDDNAGHTVRISGALFEELWILEVDTFESDSGEVGTRKEFSTAMNAAQDSVKNSKNGKPVYTLKLNDKAFEHFCNPTGAIADTLEIIEGKMHEYETMGGEYEEDNVDYEALHNELKKLHTKYVKRG